MITKRQAALGAVSAVVGIMGQKAAIEPAEAGGGAVSLASARLPQSVSLDLSAFAEFHFTFEGKTVTMTNRQMFEALSS